MAAVVALQLAHESMLDEPRRAVRALEAMPTITAQREGRIAAAVQEQHRLLARLQGRVQRGHKRRRQEPLTLEFLAPHVDHAHIRHRSAGVPLGQVQSAITALLHIDHGLERGRGGDQHHGQPRERAPHDAHIARVVDDAVLLFVGGGVLLVDDDQSELRKRQKESGPGTHHHGEPALGDAAPGMPPLGRSQVRMPFRRPHAEAAHETVERLDAERDLRQQHQRLPSRLERRRDRLKIDFGLAGSGDAVEERHRELRAPDRADQRVGGLGLLGREQRAAVAPIRQLRVGPRGDRHLLEPAQPFQAGYHARAAATESRKLLGGHRWRVARGFQQTLARRRERARVASLERGAAAGTDRPGEHRPRRRQRIGDAHRHAQHGTERGQGILRNPFDEAAQLPEKGRRVELLDDPLELRIGDVAKLRIPDHADDLARPQRDHDEIPGRQRHLVG